MRVFMLGWEFPPFISGGLGTACYGLTKAMSAIGTDIIFVLPRPITAPFSSHVEVLSPQAPAPPATPAPAEANATIANPPTASPVASAAPPQSAVSFRPAVPKIEFRLDQFEHVSFRPVDVQMADPYQSAVEFQEQKAARDRMADERATRLSRSREAPGPMTEAPAAGASPQDQQSPPPPPPAPSQYTGDLFAEVQRYANLASELAREEKFDVVHAHDWMTYPAGMAVAALKGVPLVVHVHSTEFDRSGIHVDTRIYDIERRGMHAAMKIIAVSYLTRNQITRHYGIDPSKVEVVYNAIETSGQVLEDAEKYKIHQDEKIVLFLGRITHQKGPEYFLDAARKVLEVMDNVKFVMAGGGDLTRHTIQMASEIGIGHKVLFTGFLRGADVERVFKMADLYVMPSVSEPFGIAPLEAMSHDVPVLISKQSGVSEVLAHALKVDFWDTTEMANKIIAVLKHPPLANTLREHGSFEVRQLSWTDAARACMDVYKQAIAMVGGPRRTGAGPTMPEKPTAAPAKARPV